jgi:translocation and assembly module TamA
MAARRTGTIRLLLSTLRLRQAGVAVCLLLAAANALAQGVQYRIEIEAPAPLAKLLEDNLDIVRWSKRTDVSAEQLEQLMHTAPDQVRGILATEGYFSAHVRTSLDQQKEMRAVRLAIEPGEPTRVASIALSIVGDATKSPEGPVRIERAKRAFRISPGDVFRQADWNAAKERVVRSLARRVYATARVDSSKAQIDPAARTAALELTVDSGPPVTLGPVRVSGLRRYPEKLVLNLNPIVPGTPYDEDELLKYQRRLLATGYFASAIVNATPERTAPHNVPVDVLAVESAAKRVELGVGFSTDRGPRAQIDYSDRNLLDRAWRFSSNLYVDRLSQQVTGGIEWPRRESGWRYGLEGQFKNEDIQGQRITNWSVTGAHTYTVEEYESAQSLQFLTERQQLQDGTRDDRDALFINQAWMWNNLDDLVNPRKGYVARLQVGGATQGLLSTKDFARIYAKINYLYPLGRQWSIGLRAEGGIVVADSRAGIPSPYVFRTGGDTTVRGYPFESLGVSEGDAVVGGRYMAVGSVELTRWITREWGAAVFYDVGNAFDDRHEFDPVAGYGAGVRWRSPIGSLALDLAYGEEISEWRVHFNAGFAFR